VAPAASQEWEEIFLCSPAQGMSVVSGLVIYVLAVVTLGNQTIFVGVTFDLVVVISSWGVIF